MERHEQFLIEKTRNVRHSGREFIEHLRGTQRILKERGNLDYVCLAGLFHSVYGTNTFRHAVVSVNDRDRVQDLIGDDAELLAYMFCTADRPADFLRPPETWPPGLVRDLREIEIANLTEQKANPKLVQRLEFERCWPWLKESRDEGSFVMPDGTVWPTHSKDDIWRRIVDGKSFFWPGRESTMITELYTSPTGLKSHHIWLAGGELEAIKEMERTIITEFGRQRGCHRQTGSGRLGWARAFKGYRITGYRKEKSLL